MLSEDVNLGDLGSIRDYLDQQCYEFFYLVLDRIRAAPNDVVDDPEGFAERCLERTLDQIQIGSAKRRMDELQQQLGIEDRKFLAYGDVM